MPTPSARPIVSIAPRGHRIAGGRELGDQRPGQLAALLQRVAELRVRPPRDGQRRLAHERRAGGDGLEAAPVRAVALARAAVHLDDHVAHLGAAHDPAAVDLAAQQQPAADPGAEREQRDVGRALRDPDPRLADHVAVRVVVDHDGHPEPLGHHGPERDVLERHVDGLHRHPRPRVERARDAEPDRLDRRADRRADLVDRIGDHLHEFVLREAVNRTVGTVDHRQVIADRARQQLRAAKVDADDVSLGHAGGHYDMAEHRDDDKPQYTLYRARPKFLRRRDDDGGLRDMQQAPAAYEEPPPKPRRPRRRIGVWRIVRWLVAGARGVAAHLADPVPRLRPDPVRAGLRRGRERARRRRLHAHVAEHGPACSAPTRARSDSKEPGANKIGEPLAVGLDPADARSAAARTRRSRSRATRSSTSPATGRTRSTRRTRSAARRSRSAPSSSTSGSKVNHLVEVNFENFPQLIDALGGITYRGGCVVSRINGGFKNGGYTLRLKAGEQEIDGKQALALARTRKNECNKRENDLTRARRQQKIMGSIKDKVTSFETFVAAAVGRLGGAEGDPLGHVRPVAARPRRRRADRGHGQADASCARRAR